MLSAESPIIRLAGTGLLNTISDTYIGGAPAGSGDLAGSQYAGQLGKILPVGSDSIGVLTDTGVGTLFAGAYQYVRRRATDDDSPALAPGKIAFWDTVVSSFQTAYQVTTDENLSSSDNAVMIAGIFIGNIQPDEYGFIQILGEVYVRFRSVLTAAGAIGSRVYAAGAGDTGADQGTADVLTTDSTSLANARFLGVAIEAPTGGSLSRIFLRPTNSML